MESVNNIIKQRLFPLTLVFKDAWVFVVGRETFFNEWDGHCYYHSVLKVDSCILKSCSNYSEKKGFCRGYSERCVVCASAPVLCVLKGIYTSLPFTVTGHSEGGSGWKTQLANQKGPWTAQTSGWGLNERRAHAVWHRWPKRTKHYLLFLMALSPPTTETY